MRCIRSALPLLLPFLVACSTGGGAEPSSVLSMRYPIFSATSPETMVRIDQDGRVEQAVRIPNGGGWKVFSSSTRPDRVTVLMNAFASVSPVAFRGPQAASRVFTITAETADGRIELSYDDSSLPCADDAFRRFESVWTRLNDMLPQALPETELPRCGIAAPEAPDKPAGR